MKTLLYKRLSEEVHPQPLILHSVAILEGKICDLNWLFLNDDESIGSNPLLLGLLLKYSFDFDVNYQNLQGNTVLHILWRKYHHRRINIIYTKWLLLAEKSI